MPLTAISMQEYWLASASPSTEETQDMSRTNADVLKAFLSDEIPVPSPQEGRMWGARNLQVAERVGQPGRLLYSYTRLAAIRIGDTVYYDTYMDPTHRSAMLGAVSASPNASCVRANIGLTPDTPASVLMLPGTGASDIPF